MAKRTKKPARNKSTSQSTQTPKSPRASRRATPKPTPKGHGDHDIEFIARGLWLHGSRALLCRNLDKRYLYLPGGHVDFGESAGEALEREFVEETGVRVAAGPLMLVTEAIFETRKRWHHELNLVFRVERSAPGGKSAPGMDEEATEAPRIASREKGIGFEWVDLAAAVDLDIRPLAVKAWLAAGAGVDPAAAKAEWVSEIPR